MLRRSDSSIGHYGGNMDHGSFQLANRGGLVCIAPASANPSNIVFNIWCVISPVGYLCVMSNLKDF